MSDPMCNEHEFCNTVQAEQAREIRRLQAIVSDLRLREKAHLFEIESLRHTNGAQAVGWQRHFDELQRLRREQSTPAGQAAVDTLVRRFG
jgi:hypothetical protein